jgi:Pyruvate/2-oxoacid:ferredoxin oxidoreductase gamma subunit
MLDIWALCTAYYSPRNKLKRKDLYDLIKSYDFELGLLVDKPRPEYSTRYREAFDAVKGAEKPRTNIEKKFDNSVDRQIGIVIAGSAGQKIKSTASLFAEAGMFSGLEATQKDDYPITVMTGHSVAEIILSPERIEYTAIDSPDYFIVISEDGLKRTRPKIAKLPETCTIFVDDSLELPETRAKVVTFPFKETGKSIGKLSVAVAAMAAVLTDSGMFPIEAFGEAISAFQKPAIAEINLKAVDAGKELVKK